MASIRQRQCDVSNERWVDGGDHDFSWCEISIAGGVAEMEDALTIVIQSPLYRDSPTTLTLVTLFIKSPATYFNQ